MEIDGLNWLRSVAARDDRFVLAVSGGADSMAMLHMLAASRAIDSSLLHVFHVDHGLRPSSKLDWEIVADYCEKLGVTAVRYQVDVPTFARAKRLSIEQAARLLRYEVLQNAAAKTASTWILTAHTADDSFETILMKMQDGSPWYEWTGIPSKRGNILRPLLALRRKIVREYVADNRIPFREDESNADPRFRRNRLRSLVNSRSDLFTNDLFSKVMMQSANISGNLSDLRRLAVTLFLGSEGASRPAIRLEKERILQYFNKLAFIPVEAAWARLLGQGEGRLSSAVRQQILKVVTAGTPTSVFQLPGEVTMERRAANIWLYQPNLVQTNISLEPDQLQSTVPSSQFKLSSDSRISPRTGDRWCLRNWKAGDRVKLPNRPRKKVSDLLCERRVDPLTRSRTLLLTHNDEPVLLIEPSSATYRFQLSDQTHWELNCNIHE